jgi:hypothetical protein
MFIEWGTKRIHDRQAKLRAKRQRMPMNGVAFKRLLVERAAAAKKKPDGGPTDG